MRKLFCWHLIMLVSLPAMTQLKKGDILLNGGLASGYGYPSKLTSTENSGVPAATISAEYLLTRHFSIGPYIAYTNSFFKFDHPQVGYKDVWRGWDFGIRTNFHAGPVFFKNEDADIYVAAFSGYTAMAMRHDKSNIYRETIDFEESAFSVGGIVGFRYAVSPRVGLYGETGMGRKFFVGGGVGVRFWK